MSLCEEVQALCVALHEDLCAVAQAALCAVDQWVPQGVCPCVVGLKEAVVPKEVAHLVDINEADIINEVVAKIMVEEVVKEDPNLHLGEVLQTLGNNKVDPIDPNKLHGVDPKVVVTEDMVGQIWAVGIKDPLKICPGITMVVVEDDRVVGIKEVDSEEA